MMQVSCDAPYLDELSVHIFNKHYAYEQDDKEQFPHSRSAE